MAASPLPTSLDLDESQLNAMDYGGQCKYFLQGYYANRIVDARVVDCLCNVKSDYCMSPIGIIKLSTPVCDACWVFE